jgi:predicted nuclease of predicted toxin-antitoxin system
MSASPKIDLIVDESVDANITASLRDEGYAIWSVSEESPSVSDTTVLATAFEKSVLLLTEDKDFGELAIRLRKPHCGILLIRLSGVESNEKALIVAETVKRHFDELRNSFSVLDHTKLRIKISGE